MYIRKEDSKVERFVSKTTECFVSAFGGEPLITLFAPGRVNLIGEHIDYNGGRVMPCSLSVGTYGAASPRDDGRIRLVSADIPGSMTEIGADELFGLPFEPSAFARFGWAAYPLGVAAKLRARGYSVGGFEMAVCGSLPRGSGLSSSASLEVLSCAVMKSLFGLELGGVEASVVSLEAERDCAGVNCGIMDQFVCAVGKKGCAVSLDTATLDYGYFPFDTGENTLLIMNTRKPRRLADSKYNERRAECEKAKELLSARLNKPLGGLCELSPDEFEAAKDALPEPILRRARHAVYENRRVRDAASALEKDDMERFGKLLNESHDSLRYDYEVTGKELDSIVGAARAQDGVLGARMTGAGFGGCAIALVGKDRAEAAAESIARIYKKETGYDCEIFRAETADSPFAR